MTFSIVARSDDGTRWGVAVASKFLAAGAVVPGVRAPYGAIATQSFANMRYLPDGFALLESGRTAQEALDVLVAADDGRGQRQAGIVDEAGGAATFTGDECLDWAGGITGPGYAIQGNILAGPQVVAAMRDAYLAMTSDRFEARLHAALLAGDRAGGDARGRQSAALLVGGVGAGYGGGSDIAMDLRVDDHSDPVVELGRLMGIHALLFGSPESTLPLEGDVAVRLRRALDTLGYDDPNVEKALERAAGIENLEERLVPGAVDPVVLDYLETLAAAAN
ncbi:MAG: fimbrial assembly protein FimA [Actinomycetales bacterium mxb001]|nr:MAG: fimbrial assembly protein FimA [Actinomycetales bacterium mxb001]